MERQSDNQNAAENIAKGLELLRQGTKDIPVGECPKCGSNEVSTDDYDGGLGDVLYETCSCDTCGAVWKNHYEVFEQTIVDDDPQPVKASHGPEPHAAGDQ
jgi:DNA-directed RNA polymerase subunit M/transcription elongation factor TFIIS